MGLTDESGSTPSWAPDLVLRSDFEIKPVRRTTTDDGIASRG
jgi:hypothetical protein